MKKVVSDEATLEKITELVWDKKLVGVYDDADHYLTCHKDSVPELFKQLCAMLSNIQGVLSDQWEEGEQ